MGSRRFAFVALWLAVSGCAAPRFVLTDQSALHRLMATEHVASFSRRIPAPLICWVEGTEPNARFLYLGEDHPTYTVRVGAYRVTSDGRVWVNADDTYLTERWYVVK
jgi:hypothetical protein